MSHAPERARTILDLPQGDGRLRSADSAAFAALLSAPPAPAAAAPPAEHLFGGARFASVLDGVISPAECAALILETERRGYEAALLNMGGGSEAYRPDVRNNSRCIVDSPEFADALFARVAHALPAGFAPGARVVGFNERLRFLRYDPGETFKPHRDGVFARSHGPLAGQFTLVTALLYLNEGYAGCFTTFFPDDGIKGLVGPAGLAVEPRPGRVLLHDHRLLHSAPPLTAGRKYVLRTDVLFERVGGGAGGAAWYDS